MDIKNMEYLNLKTLTWCLLLLLIQFTWAEEQTIKTVDKTVNSAPVTKTSTPFGANLFSGDFQSNRNDGLDPNYRLIPGDKVALHMWGQLTIDEILTVDANGNIFIPEVGEVKVEGIKSSEIQNVVKRKVATVFIEGEGVYVSLVTTTPISVFVTGSAVKPGQYTGVASNSILTYLFKAGGIDPARGSYRDVKVLRQNRVIARYDLYPFLRKGQIKNIEFRDGDTIVVGELASTIEVEGDSLNPFRFEFLGQQMTGRQLIQYAKPVAKVTHIAITGTRNRQPWSVYLPYNQFLNTRLFDGDNVKFTSDALTTVIGIKVEGSHLGKSYYSVKKGSRLTEILDYIEVDQDTADIRNIYLKRKSIAFQQKKNLLDSISRLQRTLFTASSESDGEAALRVKESELILKYIEQARNTEIAGQVVVSENGQVANIRLEKDDVIVIPQKSDVVTISGEVMIPQSMVYAQNASIEDYINRSGGYAQRADQNRLVIRRPNGKVDMGTNLKVNPGDQIIVFPRLDPKQRQNVKDWVQIIYQIAIATIAITR
jgi:protein involved in polysaccharide export with SLBB domain